MTTKQTATKRAPGGGKADQPAARPAATVYGGPALVEALQRSAGNGAVAQVVQRLANGNGNGMAPPARPVGTSPHDDPRFQVVRGRIVGESARLVAHPSPQAEAVEAQQAAVAPADDKEAQAKAVKVEEMAGARPGGFDKAGFIAAVRQAIVAYAPKNLDEADKFADSGRPAAIKGQVITKVTDGRRTAAKDISDKTGQAPDTSVAKEKPVTPLREERPPEPEQIDAGTAMPEPAPADQTDLSAGKRETDATMAGAGVTEEQLARSNEPQFIDALTLKKEGESHSATAPGQFRISESSKLTGARGQAQASGSGGLAAMAGAKSSALAKTAAGKNSSKARDEAKRAEITAQIRGVFDATKRDVDAILDALDGAVAARFEAGEKAARDAFTADHKARMQRYKDERYSGLAGAGRWAADLFSGLPAEANQIFAQSRALYEARMGQVISDIADFVGAELGRAKSRIAEGRAEIKRYVGSQPRELRKVADDAASEFAGQFDELEAAVDSKRDALVDDLASKYVEARTAVDDEIKAMQDQNAGLWDRAKTAVAGTVDTILKLKEMLLGVLARAVGAIDRIIADPIGFLGNLVGAVKTGVTNFAANIVEHLKKGLQGWLLGSLADAGIELPDKFDLKGIVKLVLSLLGVTWANIRARIVRVIPEAVMSTLERSVGFIQVILTEGVGGLWKWVVEKLGDLRELVMSQIQDFVITKIVKAGITWLISLLNPAAAFVKACKMIYDVVMFFVEKASQIKEFVDSILDSIESIAGGGVGAVAGYIEKTLAKTLPVVLGFLASVLGLGGISDQIKSILQTIQKPVMSVVDSLVAGAVKVGKKLMGRLAGKKEGEDVRSPQRKAAALDAAMAEAEPVLEDEQLSEKDVRRRLLPIKAKHGLTSLDLVVDARRAFATTMHIEGTVNPSKSTPRKERKALPNKEILIHSRVGPAIERQGKEEVLPRPSEVGLEGSHRAHAAGPGTGAEFEEGISYAPDEVNLRYMNQGIEALIRELRDMAPDGVEVWQKVAVKQLGRTGRLESITYHIYARQGGEQRVICEATISLEWHGKTARPIVEAEWIGALAASLG
jgi:hypothetical protein